MMMNKIEYWTVSFASLLHDIGDFMTQDQISPVNKSSYVHDLLDEEKCNKLSKFLDVEIFKKLLLYFADPENSKDKCEIEPYLRFISIAEGFADNDGGTSRKSGENHVYLDSIFSRLDIGNGVPEIKRYAYAPLESGTIFPGNLDKGEPIHKLQQEFLEHWELALAEANTVEILYQMVQRVLERYTWCIPKSGQLGITDISLYDHLRLSSAIAACLYKIQSENPQFDTCQIEDASLENFILVEGDFSGIQKYIFSGASEKHGGMAKKLRARSFVITSLISLATRSLIDRCDMPASCILMNSGGNFFLLLPNLETTKNILADFQREIDSKLFGIFQGDTALHIAHTGLCGRDFAHFGDKIQEINERLAVKKRQPYSSLLQKDDCWVKIQSFGDAAYGNELGICKGCGREFAEYKTDDGAIGWRCKQEIEIGRQLVQAKAITLVRSGEGFLSLGGWSVLLYRAEGEVYALKSNDKDYPIATLWRHANHVPIDQGARILTFEEISNKSSGTNWLGYLKADMDRLGMLFAVGFRNETDENFGNITRVASLSRMMEIFFSEWLDQYIEREFPECYVVFSGGDDLFIIGPWNRVISLSIQIRKRISEFAGNNPNVTLSCGISFSQSRLPVTFAANSAEHSLSRAKEEYSFLYSSNRDQICMFDHVVKWKDIDKVMNAAEKIIRWIRESKLTIGDVRRMREYAAMFERYTSSDGKDIGGLRYIGLLAYDIGRKESEKRNGMDPQVKRFMESLRDISQNSLIHHLSVICDYALLMSRKKEG
ncbi:MAG: type III-A CRISPR-associated protein Cas10/Csm1 [Clostridiaceae bacterium]|nr:type III-A CRISPR-associated protein Cas10/Csm1 [Clostridiaceae bacterium]